MKVPGISDAELEAFCRRWKVEELSMFGSAARNELGDESDIDLLVSFHDEAEWSLLDHIEMEEELAELCGRDVDMITRRSVEQSRNWMRRDEVLSSSEPVYAEG